VKQIKRRSWLGHTLQGNDSIAIQTLQRKPQGHRRTGQPRNTWWNQKWDEQDSSTAVGRWRRQLGIELDGKSGLWPMLHWEQQGLSQVVTQLR